MLASNYRMNDYEPLRIKYRLAALPSGETMGLSFAVNMSDPELYSILNKIANLSSSEDMEYALVSYMYSNQKVSFLDFLGDNWIGVLLFIASLAQLTIMVSTMSTTSCKSRSISSRTIMAFSSPLEKSWRFTSRVGLGW